MAWHRKHIPQSQEVYELDAPSPRNSQNPLVMDVLLTKATGFDYIQLLNYETQLQVK